MGPSGVPLMSYGMFANTKLLIGAVMKFKLPFGTTEHVNAMTLPAGRFGVDMTVKNVRLHDGVTVGGEVVPATRAYYPVNESYEIEGYNSLGFYAALQTPTTTELTSGGFLFTYVGAELFKSSDGVNYTSVFTHPNSLTCTGIAAYGTTIVAIFNNSLGTGISANIYRSTNSGLTWTLVSNTITSFSPRSIAVSPAGVWILTGVHMPATVKRAYRSTNLGTAWAETTSAIATSYTNQVASYVKYINDRFVIVGEGGFISVSTTNAGTGWTKYSPAGQTVAILDIVYFSGFYYFKINSGSSKIYRINATGMTTVQELTIPDYTSIHASYVHLEVIGNKLYIVAGRYTFIIETDGSTISRIDAMASGGILPTARYNTPVLAGKFKNKLLVTYRDTTSEVLSLRTSSE